MPIARMMRDGNHDILEKFEIKIGKQITAMEIMMTSWEDKRRSAIRLMVWKKLLQKKAYLLLRMKIVN